MIDAKLETILDKDEEDFKIDDLIYMVQLLREDKSLVEYYKKRRIEFNGDKNVLDSSCDISSEIQAMFPEYDEDNLEAIQGYLQDNSSLNYLLVKPTGKDQENYSIKGSMLRKLYAAGIQFSVDFEFVPQEDDHYPVALLEVEHFILRI